MSGADAVKARKVAGVRRLVDRELPSFFVKLAAMLDAGVSILAALKSLVAQADRGGWRTVVEFLQGRVEAGDTLSSGMRMYPAVFREDVVALVVAGESSGRLASVLKEVGAMLESEIRLRKRLRSALVYPGFVALFGMLVTVCLLVFVLPAVRGFFADFGAPLPGPTRVLIRVGDVLRYYAAAIGIGVLWFAACWPLIRRRLGVRLALGELMLRMPGIGALLQALAVARVGRVLGSMLDCGVPVMSAMRLAVGCTGVAVLDRRIGLAADAVAGGLPVSEALEAAGLFMPAHLQMVRTGEQTGRIDVLLRHVADAGEEDLTQAVQAVGALLQPLTIILLGLVLGFVVIGIVAPLFQMAGIVQ